MLQLRPLLFRLRSRLRRRAVSVWYDPRYRLPLSGLEGTAGMEPRRADFAAWWLKDCGAVAEEAFRKPHRISYENLARAHAPELLELLGRPETLARIFGVDPSDVPVDEVMTTIRLACGGTLGAARETLRTGAPALNLLGGFHHSGPTTAGGFCPVNDVAVAVATLRADGLSGRVVVLDLDAHPPDGLAAAFGKDPRVFVGSLSGSDWGPLEGVDETVLAEGTGDEEYLAALRALLARAPRAPRAQLAFVIAGGDVLAGDRFGRLGLTLAGARRRDLLVSARLEGVPAVWLPGGGYTDDAWRALAGTGMAVATRSTSPIPSTYDPLSQRFAVLAAGLSPQELTETEHFTAEDLEESLGIQPRRQRLLLGFYTRAGLEHALYRYGILDHLERLGYRQFRVEFDRAGPGERMRVFGRAGGAEHALIELVLERRRVFHVEVLYVHWLSLRNPRAQFSAGRPRLPGQEVPGLGLAREIANILARMAIRLGLGGVVVRPSHYHTAYGFRHAMTFVDPERQGRFEALVRDLEGVPLLEATVAISEGRVRMNGAPYAWEADEMAYWLRESPHDPGEAEREKLRVRFELVREPATGGSAPGSTPGG